MATSFAPNDAYLSQLRLLLEELCCDLCRFVHSTRNGGPPETIRIDREYCLGLPGAFADIRCSPPGQPPYFVEVKNGYPDDALVRHLRRKYRQKTERSDGVAKVILVIDSADRPDWQRLEAELAQCLWPGLKLEIWNERHLLGLLRECFGVEVESITAENLIDVRQTIDRAKGFIAFGASSPAEYVHDPLKSELLWHFGSWRLQKLRESRSLTPREILHPGHYRGVVVLLADLCSFSSYVRDTPDTEIVRECLTGFYSKARYQIINNGGMLYQFVGDEVIGLFGLPDRPDDTVLRAIQTAQALVSIGNAVSNHWQRRIDRVQTSRGLHIGMAIGDLQIVSLRPFSRTHMGAVGDCINVAARLMSTAGPGEIVVTNSLYQELDEDVQGSFLEIEPVEAKNVGRIKAWKWREEQTS